MQNQLLHKEKTLAVIGMGYVGLPIALEFAKKVKTIGFDINSERIILLNKKTDPSGEISEQEFIGKDLFFTDDQEDLKKASFFIIAVPTPINIHKMPDLTALKSASSIVGQALKKGDFVVFESTVYPGCTEEECLPILEKASSLKVGNDFKIGYSPERINPGDKEHTLAKIKKVVSGCDKEALDIIASVYEIVVKAGIHKVSSIKIAEAAKIIENTQRDLNIALMNELSLIFEKQNINTYEVLEAAGTKWNFLKFSPGLVGGHCIGVDPYYLTYKAQELGYQPRVILSGRTVNDQMGAYIGRKAVQLMILEGVNILGAKALVLGTTFKENVKDIRNSKVIDVVKELISFGIKVDIFDPLANEEEFKKEYNLELIKKTEGKYQAIILAVCHNQFKNIDQDYLDKRMEGKMVFIDVKGFLRNSSLKNITYWSL